MTHLVTSADQFHRVYDREPRNWMCAGVDWLIPQDYKHLTRMV